MDLLIFIIIIAIVISKMSKKNAKKKPSTVKEVNRNTRALRKEQEKQQEKRRKQFEAQQAQARQKQQQIQQAQPRRQSANKQQSAARQQELKSRLEEKYGKVAKNTGSYGKSQMQKPSQPENSILERAKGHVEEEAADELKMQDAMLHEAAGGGKKHTEPSDNRDADANALMDKVYDLMITGYSGNMEFDRDFLAEAVDMLNRIQN